MKFLQGYADGEYSFNLYYALGKYHYFATKCGHKKKHVVAVFGSDAEAMKWHNEVVKADMHLIENGVELNKT